MSRTKMKRRKRKTPNRMTIRRDNEEQNVNEEKDNDMTQRTTFVTSSVADLVHF